MAGKRSYELKEIDDSLWSVFFSERCLELVGV